jgi:hypothetical protein
VVKILAAFCSSTSGAAVPKFTTLHDSGRAERFAGQEPFLFRGKKDRGGVAQDAVFRPRQ